MAYEPILQAALEYKSRRILPGTYDTHFQWDKFHQTLITLERGYIFSVTKFDTSFEMQTSGFRLLITINNIASWREFQNPTESVDGLRKLLANSDPTSFFFLMGTLARPLVEGTIEYYRRKFSGKVNKNLFSMTNTVS